MSAAFVNLKIIGTPVALVKLIYCPNKGVGADTAVHQRPLRDYALGPVQLNSLRSAIDIMQLTIQIVAFLGFGLVGSLQAEIRKFDKTTIEKLGVAIYEQDVRAAIATDLLFAEKIDPAKDGLRGWVVEGDVKAMLVRFVRERDGVLQPFYDVQFKGKGRPEIRRAKDAQLSEAQNAQFTARTLAMKSIKRPASTNYNFVILPDPEKKAFLVYGLAATSDPDSIIVGGHYRFSVSSDGATIERADELFRSFMTLKKPKDSSTGAKAVGPYMTTLVSDMPLEIHVYLSLLNKMPFVVGTRDQHVWKVENGHMEIIK